MEFQHAFWKSSALAAGVVLLCAASGASAAGVHAPTPPTFAWITPVGSYTPGTDGFTHASRSVDLNSQHHVVGSKGVSTVTGATHAFLYDGNFRRRISGRSARTVARLRTVSVALRRPSMTGA